LIAVAAAALATAAALAGGQAEARDPDVIGHSRQGRPIVARVQGDPGARRSMLVVGSIHGDETEGQRVVRRLRHRARKPQRAALWTIQTVNPDGVAAGSRGNARAIDLNRNFAAGWRPIPPSSGYYSGPEPFSEPETRAVRRFLRRVRPDVTVWYHQPFGRTLIPCERRGRGVALRYARLSGLPARDCYPTPPGAATGWQDRALAAKAFVVEFGPGSVSRAQVRRHARAVLRIAR
jgi:protein MpaA